MGQRRTSASAMNPNPRSFGLSVGGVFALMTALFLWRGRMTAATVTGVLATVLILPALVWPSLLRRPAVLWFRFSHLLGWVNTRILLSALFIVVFTPLGVMMRLFGWDPLGRRRRPATAGWAVYSARQRELKHYERMY
jgi:hypothetical protein